MWLAVGVGLGVGTAVGVSCSHRNKQEQCYPRDASLDYSGEPTLRPFCDWKVGQLPDPPEGIEYTWTVFVAFEPTEDDPCDPCDVERFDALLQAKIEERCDQPYEGFTRGCYIPVEEDGKYCWAEGIYFSNCKAADVDGGGK